MGSILNSKLSGGRIGSLIRSMIIFTGLLLAFSLDGNCMAAVDTNMLPTIGPANPVVRIKDITRVQGVRDNQLVGLGLVVGLDGTGDGASSQANIQMVANMLQQFGIFLNSDYLRFRNVAAVMVTANLPAFARPGAKIDVTVSSIGDARSLQGGVLLQTPLQGADGKVYAVAQGALTLGGQSALMGQSQRTSALTALAPGGGIVERDVPATFVEDNTITLLLINADFSTANRVAESINSTIGAGTASAIDQGTIQVIIPEVSVGNPVEFLAAIEELSVAPDAPARVVVNERTGTVIIGASVRIAPVAVTHGSLAVRIGAESTPLFGYEANIAAERTTMLGGSSVEDIVKALNLLGATPKDVISLLQAIKAAGALYAELVVI
jgi:flagellar P-ring protein precursor FlgI